ncbi:MAG: NUDIX domain-containing protein [Anaerolineales bacterium]|nr:NUDIX domain-containing protein [Anaerolineales bacterium]
MSPGRFLGGIGALIREQGGKRYLLLRRSEAKDFGAGVWECVTGRVEQGEGFEQAMHREVVEELGVQVRVEFIIGTTHFYRGETVAENELIGVVYCGTLDDPAAIRISPEHSEYRWVDAQEAETLLASPDASTQWLLGLIRRAERMQQLQPESLREYGREAGFELG